MLETENVISGLVVVLLFFCLTLGSVAQLGRDGVCKRFLPVSAILKFAQRLMPLTSGWVAPNIL